MRSIDHLPAWGFVALAAFAFGGARAGRLFALLRQNRGGMELAGFITLAVFLLVLIFAVRRRQAGALRSSVHVLGAMVAGNGMALAIVWPFLPAGIPLSFAPMLRDTLAAGMMMSLLTLPLAAALLWLSRRYGSHSFVTERRRQVIRDTLQRHSGPPPQG